MTTFDTLPPAQQAGIICNDDRFQRFAATRCGFPDGQFSTSAAAEYLRDCCKITSRRDLNTDPQALARFQILCTDFDAWTGKIATPPCMEMVTPVLPANCAERKRMASADGWTFLAINVAAQGGSPARS